MGQAGAQREQAAAMTMEQAEAPGELVVVVAVLAAAGGKLSLEAGTWG